MTDNTFDPDGSLTPKTVRTRTDVMFQDFSVYIEGVQVPFTYINVSTNLGESPRMSLQVPPQVGLMDITRFYQPKVHVFFTDPVTGKDCLFFTGNIVGSNYTKSVSSPPQKAITFQCQYKYHQIDLVTLEYAGYAGDSNANHTDTNQNEAAVKVNPFNSLQSIQIALTGVDASIVGGKYEVALENIAGKPVGNSGVKANSIPTYLYDWRKRFMGFPGVLLNLWNQLKEQTYADASYYEVMTRLYIPLVEEGLQFFKRVGGHYFLEEQLNNTKSDPCAGEATGGNSLETEKRLVPPCYKSLMISAIDTEVATQSIQSALQHSGEFTSLENVYKSILNAIEYDLVYLNSPAEVPLDPTNVNNGSTTYAVDVLVKPQMPFYYSPLCNVWLPNMIESISVNIDDEAVPTRITAVSDVMPGSTGTMGVNYRAPESIREAVARGVAGSTGANYYSDLASTTASAQFKVGKFEQGRGVKHSRLAMPAWLAYFASKLDSISQSEAKPDSTSAGGLNIELLRKAWQYRYDPTGVKKQLNPWDSSSNVNTYQRLLFTAADYRFTMEAAKSRTGTVRGIFNPYCIPGYPMDIIDETPSDPSFHAFCVSVSHSISSRSIGTECSFVSALTYSEMGNYELHYLHPWMMTALGLVVDNGDGTFKNTIVNNSAARDKADNFYKSALGVGAAPPERLYDYSTGRPYPFSRTSGIVSDAGSNVDPHLSGEGNLSLVYRPIETKDLVMQRQGIKFIDMTQANYNPVVFSYKQPVMDESKLMEPGQSMFLDYADTIAASSEENAVVST